MLKTQDFLGSIRFFAVTGGYLLNHAWGNHNSPSYHYIRQVLMILSQAIDSTQKNHMKWGSTGVHNSSVLVRHSPYSSFQWLLAGTRRR